MTSQTLVNDSEKAGQLATRKEIFGAHSRYAIAAVHTRFGELCWVVWDTEAADPEEGLAKIVRQAKTKAEALSGLESAYSEGVREIRCSRSYRVDIGWTR